MIPNKTAKRVAKIAVLPGDGIGQEVVPQALRVLDAICKTSDLKVELIEASIGGAAFDHYGSHFPEETAEVCRNADAIFFGSVGGPIAEAHLPKWQNCERNSILSLRKEFSFFANLRSLRVYQELAPISPLRPDLVEHGIDILVVRELLGDIYFGEHATYTNNGQREAKDIATYNESQIRQIARVAFSQARTRKNSVISVDKANVLDTSKLWREITTLVQGTEFPDVKLEHMLVDNCAMQLVRKPSYFDVLLAPNLFGDILSDLVSVLGGSLGLMPSASLNDAGFGLYEPAGGSAPDIAGKNIANPLAQILSLALLLRYSLARPDLATRIESAAQLVQGNNGKTADLCLPHEIPVSTEEFVTQLIKRL